MRKIFLCCSGIGRVAGLNDGPKIYKPHKNYEEGNKVIVLFRHACVIMD